MSETDPAHAWQPAVDPEVYARTRAQLHGVAEHLLAAEQWRTLHEIRLTVTPGGFATELPADGPPLLAVAGTDLITGAGMQLPLRGTLGELAEAVGVRFGLTGTYEPASGAGPDTELDPDPLAAAVLAQALAAGDAALSAFRSAVGPGDGPPVLWPEHFDVAITVDEVNYGVSPGDGYEPRPYAYVGPWTPRRGGFWNAPFGACRPLAELDGAAAVLEFFDEGRTRAGS